MKSGNWAKAAPVLLGALCFALGVFDQCANPNRKVHDGRPDHDGASGGAWRSCACRRQRPRRQDGGWHHSPFPQFTGKAQKARPHPLLKVRPCLGEVQSGMELGSRIEGKSVGADHAFD